MQVWIMTQSISILVQVLIQVFASVLDLDAFERNTKAEGLGVGADGAAGEKNMHDAEFTCTLFRFIQLTCEGHNLGTSPDNCQFMSV